MGSLFGVFFTSVASLGPLWDELLRRCLHSCAPTPFLVRFGAQASPGWKFTAGAERAVGLRENVHLATKVRIPCGSGAASAKLLLRAPLKDESLK